MNTLLNTSIFRLEEDTMLEWPYRKMRVEALRDFSAQDTDQLPFHREQIFIVIGQEGYRQGWWRGRYNSQVSTTPLYNKI